MADNEMMWNWTYICETGLTPWLPQEKYLAPCFQEICLQIPAFIIFSLVSAFYFGNQTVLVRRNGTQNFSISMRIMTVLFSTILQFYKMYDLISSKVQIWPIDVLTVGFQIITGYVHIGFLFSLRHHGDKSHRGPLLIIVVWIILALLSIVWLFQNSSHNKIVDQITCFLHVLYGLTLTLKGSATYVARRTRDDERQSLIGTTYFRFQDDIQIEALGQAQDEAPILSKLLFYWVNPLIEKGLSGNLRRIDDLFDLPECLSLNNIIEKLQNALAQSISLMKALHRVFGIEFYMVGLLRFAADMLSFGGPLLLAALLSSQSGDNKNNNGTDMKAYAYAFGLFATTLLDAFIGTHFNWRMSLISMKMRIGITSTIYRKTLTAQFVDGNSPEVLNLMSTDTDRIVNSCISFHSFWSIPFRLFASLYLLYTQIGIAFVGGVIFGVILIPINRWLANKISSLSSELLTAKDARVSQSMEALSGIKQIKILAWEDVFIERIQNLRKTELKALSKRKYLDALCVYFWATTPIIINLLTFGTATLLGTPMTAATTFASIALLNMLIAPLNAFPWVLNGLVEAWISLKRVQSYLDLPDVDFNKYYSPLKVSTPSEEKASYRPIVISMKNVSFEYNAEGQRLTQTDRHSKSFFLNSISGDIKKGDLVCVEGSVGSGKSAFLNAINGNLNRVSGFISIENANEGIAYVAQQPWLQHGTLRENILWGKMFDESRYRKVLWACALQKDIQDLGGDNIDIGEGGSSLSGGQKARVALARAVYQDKQIILIDDVLASLDAHVSKHIIKHCILGILHGRTRIIVTESRTLFYYSNQILRVDEGVVSVSDFSLGSFESDIATESTSSDEFSSPVNFELSNEEKPSRSIFDEIKESGALSARVLAVYWKAWGPTMGFIVFLSIVLMQASKNFSDTWLAHWIMSTNSPNSNIHLPVESPIESNIPRLYVDKIKYNVICMIERFMSWRKFTGCESVNNSTFVIDESQTASNNFYLFIYIGIAIFNSVITLVRSFAFAFAGIKAAKFIHERLLNSVFFTEFTFFDITPLGRILNRFSSDTYIIDDSLPFILNILLATLAGLIGSLCVSLYAMPWLGLLVVPMIPIYLNIQSRYRNSSRDIKRLSSNAMSPIYIHFAETVQGQPTIRSMRANNRFNKDFLVKLEDSIRAQLTASAAQQWLALRLQLLGSFLVGGSGLIAVITSADSTVPELTGLVISYSLSITAFLSGVINTLTETEQELIAVERVYGYSRLNPEVNANGSRDPPFGWPCQGVVKFENVSLKYRSYLQPALKKITFQTETCERIGIIGRTGAGKSSIMAALIRIVPVTTGTVTIDSIDVSTLPLNVLRSRISFAPQDAFLFSGSIRENLDPRNLHLDSHIWDAINRCMASPLVQRLGGLNGVLDTKGSNISSGQKQLLCLARALLRKSKVVIIDEGTSNLDSESENAIHLILRNAFESSTVLLIAHRLNGLQETNRIFVVDDGEIVENGYSQVLATDPTSRFFALLQQQQQNR